MKKLFLIILIACSINQLVHGQTNTFVPVTDFGIRQGANLSFVEFSPSIAGKMDYGYNGGLVFRHTNEELFAVQVELNFSQKGWIEDFDTIPNTYSRKLNYVEIPFMAQIYFGKRKLNYYVNLGTAFAYLISEKETMEINDPLYTREYYNKPIENNFDYSVVAELGIRYDSKIGAFNFGGRYYYTVTSLYKFDAANIYEISRNQVINISLTYFIFSK
ncbi:MAG: porin family protein [Bacteroidales bacterium]|nr:porin family protein [Bacteroidales bacterium]